MNLADKVLVLNEGKIELDTTPSELFQMDNLDQYFIEIPHLYKLLKLLKKGGFAENLSKISSYDELIQAIYKKMKGSKKND